MEPGTVLGGKYRVVRNLGRGGMGIVVEAIHEQLATPVAIKILHDEYAREPVIVERFLREARAAAPLRGEHICRVQDFGTSEDGTSFMVMELLDGRDLAVVLDKAGALPTKVIAVYMMQVCQALAEPHALGMVHRDLKPGNLFLTTRPDGSPSIKIVDFGIAKSTGPVDFSLTATTSVMGSPAYMAPEQLRSNKAVDPRSDIWALGVSMYELVSDTKPFDADTLTDLALKITSDDPPPLPASIPAEFAAIVMRCLEKDPARRYPDIAALAAALAPFATKNAAELAESTARVLATSADKQAKGQAAPADVALPPLDPPSTTTLGRSTGSLTGSLRPKRNLAVSLMLAFSLVVGAVVIVFVARGGPGAAKDSPAQPAQAPATQPQVPPAIAPDAAPMASDAAIGALPDATEPAVDAGAAAVVVPDAAITPPSRPVKKPKRPRRDLGESRF